MNKINLSAKLTDTKISGSLIRYIFTVYKDGEILFIDRVWVPIMMTSDKGVTTIKKENGKEIWEWKNIPCIVQIDAEDDAPKWKVIDQVEHQLLMLKQTMRRPKPDIEKAHDISEILLTEDNDIEME